MQNGEYPRDNKTFRVISKYYSRFVILLMEQEEETAGGGDDVDDQVVPHEFMCPITRELLNDPVVAADGFTYERAMMLTWLEVTFLPSIYKSIIATPD